MLHLQKQIKSLTMENSHSTHSAAPVKCTLMNNSIKYGLYTGIAMVLLSLLFYALDVKTNSWPQYVSIGVLLAGLIVGTLAFRDKCNGGYISYGRSLGSGVMISLITGVILAIYSYLNSAFLNPEIIEQMMRAGEENMIKQGLSDDQIDQAMGMTTMFMTPVFIAITSFFSMLLWGTLISLLASIFIKKDNQNFEQVFADVEN